MIVSDDIDFKQPALVPLDLETHGGDDVAVFSMGPGQHLFSGLYEQNAIPHIIKYASCVNPELSACSSAVSITISFMTIITITLFHLSDFS